MQEKRILITKYRKWQLSVKNSIQLYEKEMLLEKFVSFKEVRFQN